MYLLNVCTLQCVWGQSKETKLNIVRRFIIPFQNETWLLSTICSFWCQRQGWWKRLGAGSVERRSKRSSSVKVKWEFFHFGVPKKTQTHQGPQFAAKQFQKLLDCNGAVFTMAMLYPSQERLGQNKRTFWMICEVDVKFHCKDPKSSHFELGVFQCGTCLVAHYCRCITKASIQSGQCWLMKSIRKERRWSSILT